MECWRAPNVLTCSVSILTWSVNDLQTRCISTPKYRHTVLENGLWELLNSSKTFTLIRLWPLLYLGFFPPVKIMSYCASNRKRVLLSRWWWLGVIWEAFTVSPLHHIATGTLCPHVLWCQELPSVGFEWNISVLNMNDLNITGLSVAAES